MAVHAPLAVAAKGALLCDRAATFVQTSLHLALIDLFNGSQEKYCSCTSPKLCKNFG
jgi:hypothetical protein